MFPLHPYGRLLIHKNREAFLSKPLLLTEVYFGQERNSSPAVQGCKLLVQTTTLKFVVVEQTCGLYAVFSCSTPRRQECSSPLIERKGLLSYQDGFGGRKLELVAYARRWERSYNAEQNVCYKSFVLCIIILHCIYIIICLLFCLLNYGIQSTDIYISACYLQSEELLGI